MLTISTVVNIIVKRTFQKLSQAVAPSTRDAWIYYSHVYNIEYVIFLLCINDMWRQFMMFKYFFEHVYSILYWFMTILVKQTMSHRIDKCQHHLLRIYS